MTSEQTIYHLRCDDCGAEGAMTRAEEVCPECHLVNLVYTCICPEKCGIKLCMECLNAMGAGHHWRVFAQVDGLIGGEGEAVN